MAQRGTSNHPSPGEMSARVQRASARALTLSTEHLLGVAASRAPIEEGILEGSGKATVDDADLIGAVSFNTPYAVRQHEDMGLRHDAGREAKYLERSATEERATIARIHATELQRGLS